MLLLKWNRFLTIIFILLLSACGGGGSGGGDEDPGNTQTFSHVNGDLGGYLFIADDGKYLDLSSGEYIRVDRDSVDYMAFPSTDGSEFVTTIDDFRTLPGLGPDNDAIIIKSMLDGRTIERFEVSNSIIGAAKLSPDQQTLAAIWRDESVGEDYNDEKLTLFSRDGSVLNRSHERDVGSFDWLPDGRLVYTVDSSIFITIQINDVSSSTILTIFDTTRGKPTRVAASPDGTRLVFERFTGGSPSPFVRWRDATLWMMNVDGSDLRMLATSNRDKPRINSPVWSPDGNWVATVEGYIGGITPVYDPISPGEWRWDILEGVPGVLYAVPSDSDNLILPSDGSTGVVPVVRSSGEGLVRPVFPGFSPEMKWVSGIPISQEARGSLPTNTGAVNGGLSGNLYFDDDGQGDTTALHSVTLESAGDQLLFALTDDDLDNVRDLVYASSDAQLFAHYFDDGSDSAIYIRDRSGQILSGIKTEASFYEMNIRNAVRFSPVDQDLILVSYTDFLSGSPTFLEELVSVLNWREKRFVIDFDGREYNAADWTPDGNIILAGKEGNVYQSIASGGSFTAPTLLIPGKESIHNLVVSPDGNRLAYSFGGHIWTSNLSGDNFKRLTGPTDDFNVQPEWSPDGNYLAFKQVDADDGPLSSGNIWVIASDAENVRIRDTGNTPNAVPLKAGDDQVRVFGTFSWR